ncbi:MAG TPA: cyclic nucleotide-binding domain-containing protein [Candidatus Sulfotelmatobacter sp.]|nr:cyclic nucleotide-binding domain-containing protein [Candidatus Sulfotelmatobacter sp.]
MSTYGTSVRDLLAESHVFAGLPDSVLDQLAGCGTLAVFPAGAAIFHTGQPANDFQVIRHGRVSIEMAAPGREPIVVATRGEGDAVGWSWLFEPYRWHFDAMALEPTRVISLDGECLRGKAGEDHELGYHLMSRFADLAIKDLELTELQLLDVYGHVAGR